MAALTSIQTAALTTLQFRSLKPAELAALSTASISALTTAQLSSAYTTKLQSLTSDQILAFTTNQIRNGFTTSAVSALTSVQLPALNTSSLVSMTTLQLHAISATQEASLSNSQINALISTSSGGKSLINYVTPIVLDLTGKGIQTTNIAEGVNFDLLGNGQSMHTGWIAEGEGLLVLDPHNTNTLSSGAQLFGQGTTLANGDKAVDGYQALTELDTNGDGFINAQDAQFNELKVWVDTGNSSGNATGVMESLSQLGITQLNLNAQASTHTNHGNLVGLISSFVTSSGATGTMADVWFAAQAAPHLSSSVTTLPHLSAETLAPKIASTLQALSQFNANGQAVHSTPLPLNNSSSGQIPMTLNSSSSSGGMEWLNTASTSLSIPSKKNAS